jgi:hypothetical protein
MTMPSKLLSSEGRAYTYAIQEAQPLYFDPVCRCLQSALRLIAIDS